jgi:5-methylcytosine-specific restriction endonuclease McrA
MKQKLNAKKTKKPQFSYELMLNFQMHQCFYCGKHLDNVGHDHITAKNGYTRDHFFPRSWGNNYLMGNMVLSCAKCNTKKSDNPPSRAELIRFVKLWSKFDNRYLRNFDEFFVIQEIVNHLNKWMGHTPFLIYIG